MDILTFDLMPRFLQRPFLFFIFLFSAHLVLGEETDSLATATKPYKAQVIPSPSVLYTKNTGWMLGAFGIYQFKLNRCDTLTRSSYFRMYGGMSFKQQILFYSNFNLFTNQEKWMVLGTMRYLFYPEDYFGIGTDTKYEDKRTISYRLLNIEISTLKKITGGLFAGAILKTSELYDVMFPNPSPKTPENKQPVIGNMGGSIRGIGVGLLLDKRNSVLTPTRNYMISGSFIPYKKFLGSDFEYDQITIDLRKYWRIKQDDGNVIASQFISTINMGNVPFVEMGKLGGRYLLRGFQEGRYRDKNSIILQAEWRKHLFWRLGFTTFAGVGQVSPNIRSILTNSLKPAVGTGLRLNVNRKDTANVRFDVGFTERGSNFYVSFGEAF